MNNFKILKAKKNLLVELINEHGGLVTFSLMIICLTNLFFMSGSVMEIYYRLGISAIYLLINYFFYIFIAEEFKSLDNKKRLRVLYVTIIILAIMKCDSFGPELSSGNMLNLLFGLFAGLLVLFALLFIIGISYLMFILLYKIYVFFISCFIYATLPTSKEELEECGVENRIDCALYYLYMQKGFMRWKRHSTIYLKDFNKHFGNLTKIFYDFRFSYDDYRKLYSACRTSPEKKKLLSVLAVLVPEHEYSYGSIMSIRQDTLIYHLKHILNTQDPDNKNIESILLQFNDILEK